MNNKENDVFTIFKKIISGFSILPAFILMFFPLCKYSKDTGYEPGAFGGWVMMSKSITIGNFYQFIFGSNSVGYHESDTINFNFALFIGFLGLIVYLVFSLISMFKAKEHIWKVNLARTISCGIATFFLNPFFLSLACDNFYNNSVYIGNYKRFSISYITIMLLFFLLLAHFVLNLIFFIKSVKARA